MSRNTHIPNDALEDARLSLRARGLLAYFLSKPNDWNFNSAQVARMTREGRDAVRAAQRELAECGYLENRRERGSDGRIRSVIIVRDAPEPDFQAPEHQGPGESGL